MLDQDVGLGLATAGAAAMGDVVEPEPHPVATCQRQLREGIRVDARTRHGCRHRRLLDGDQPAPEARRQHLLELGGGPERRLLDAGHGPGRRGPQADRHRDGLLVVEEQGWQGRADPQAIAPGDPGLRIHRIAQVAQPRDVLADRAGRHRQARRELLAGPVTPALEQAEQSQQPCGRLQHLVILVLIEERNVPHWSLP